MFTEQELNNIMELKKSMSLSDAVTFQISKLSILQRMDDFVKDITTSQEELPEIFESKELCSDLGEVLESICNIVATKQLKVIGKIRKAGMKEVKERVRALRNKEKADRLEAKIQELMKEKEELKDENNK